MKISAHFFLQELLPKDVFDAFGNTGIQFIDPRIVNILEFERSFYGKPITVNNWNNGGNLNERGFRHPISGTGAKFSQHKFGRAVDRNIEGMTPQEHYASILANKQKYLEKGLTCVENIKFTPTWGHGDCRDTSGFVGLTSDSFFWDGGLLIVNP